MKKFPLILIAFLLVADVALAISNKDIITKYYAAEDYYNAEQYKKAIALCKEVEHIVGSKTIKIQIILVRAYYKRFYYKEAKEELKSYFDMNPKSTTVIYCEMSDFETKINKKIFQKMAAKKAMEKGQTLPAVEIAKVEELKFFKFWAEDGYPEKYLEKYPKGKYVNQAEEIQRKIAEIKEKEFFDRWVSDYQDPEFYLEKYPKGKYVFEAKAVLKKIATKEEQEQLDWIYSKFRNNRYVRMLELEKFLNKYPKSTLLPEVTKKLEKMKSQWVHPYKEPINLIWWNKEFIKKMIPEGYRLGMPKKEAIRVSSAENGEYDKEHNTDTIHFEMDSRCYDSGNEEDHDFIDEIMIVIGVKNDESLSKELLDYAEKVINKLEKDFVLEGFEQNDSWNQNYYHSKQDPDFKLTFQWADINAKGFKGSGIIIGLYQY